VEVPQEFFKEHIRRGGSEPRHRSTRPGVGGGAWRVVSRAAARAWPSAQCPHTQCPAALVRTSGLRPRLVHYAEPFAFAQLKPVRYLGGRRY
jgi:hypothetical protein